MSDFLAGSTALVTGASFGIGRSLSELLAPRVRHLVLTARSEEALAEVADTCRTVGMDRYCVPVWKTVPLRRTASTSLRLSAIVIETGFSQYTSLPAAAASQLISECQ